MRDDEPRRARRTRRREDDDDREEPRKSGGSNALLITLGAIGFVVLLLCGGGVFGVMYMRTKFEQARASAQVAAMDQAQPIVPPMIEPTPAPPKIKIKFTITAVRSSIGSCVEVDYSYSGSERFRPGNFSLVARMRDGQHLRMKFDSNQKADDTISFDVVKGNFGIKTYEKPQEIWIEEDGVKVSFGKFVY